MEKRPVRMASAGHSTRSRWAWLMMISAVFLPTLLIAQTTTLLSNQNALQFSARGTGNTTGVICTLVVYNPTPTPVRTVVGDCFIPAFQDYQGYVVLQTYPVEVPPFGAVSVPLSGYCTNVQSPPAPDGGSMTDVSQWVSWAAADPLPEPGKTPGPVFYFSPGTTPDDPLALTYPGTQTPFPYRLDFNRHPRHAARLLLHAAYAAGEAFEQLVREGKVRPVALGRSPETLRDDMIQQSLWAYTARLEGRHYDKTAFARQFAEEVEQQLNQPASAFPAETQQQVERQVQDLWSNISLVGSAAKLIPVSNQHPTDVFRPTPTGPPVEPAAELLQILENTDPTRPDAPDRLVPAQAFLQKNDATPALQALRIAANEKWKTFLNHRANQINPNSETALRDILTTLGHLQNDVAVALTEGDRHTVATALIGKLNTHVQARADALQTTDPDYLQKWRVLKSWEKTRWYADYCTGTHPLKKLTAVAASARNTVAFNPSNIRLTGAPWKHAFVPVTGTGPGKFPWWIPAVGIPVIGGVTYLILRDKDGGDTPLPTPPTAVPDVFSLTCGGQGTLNVLANDTGDGIAATAASSNTPGISVSVSGTTSVVVTSNGPVGFFVATYTITDQVGQTATGTIGVAVSDQTPPMVVCPPAISLEGCGQPPVPALSGQATATDFCDPTPSVVFIDELSGTPCNRIVSRRWTATDISGNSASCVQTITVQDQTAPVFTLCPPPVTVPLGQQNDLAVTGQATATDACAPPIIEPTFTDDLSGFGACGGVVVRNWSATDECGNTAACAQTITVFDAASPVITCPGPVIVDCGQQNDLAVTGQATATDDCAGPVTPTYADDPPVLPGCSGIIQRTWTATDPGGNTASCVQTITVQDQTAPVFTLCPPPVTVPLGQQNDLAVTGQATTTDDCAPPVIEPTYEDDLSGLEDCGGVVVRNWSATDECDNTAACVQEITVVDAEPPVVTCPGPVEVECGKQNDLAVTGQATATDDCAGPVTPTYTDDPPVLPGCSGIIQRTWTATDPGGNSASCIQEIAVVDVSAPVFTTCPPAISIPCGQWTDLNVTGMAQAQDACNDASPPTHTDNTSGFNGCSGTVVRTFMTADSCGNTASCVQTITVFDQTAPVFTTCPPPVFANCGQQNNLNITGQAVAEDACTGPAPVTHTDNLSEFWACEGVIWRTFVATDPCGNTATCLQAIIVSNVPCNFTPLFAIGPTVCGSCTGSISTTLSPPGSYSFLWENGQTGPNISGLCPGPISVTITDNVNECTDIYTPVVEDVPMLFLSVLQVFPPSGFSSNDGRVVLQVAPPSAQPPFLVFVNGNPIGTANTHTFQITNMPVGEYVIWIVDQNGQGCPSNEVYVEMFPQGPPPFAPQKPGFEPLVGLPGLPAAAIAGQARLANLPEHPPGAPPVAPYGWGQPVGLVARLPLGDHWQLRLELARQAGWLQLSRPTTATAVFSTAQVPIEADWQLLGLRRYFPARASKWAFYQENSMSRTVLRSYEGWLLPQQRAFPTSHQSDQWQLGIGGGVQIPLSDAALNAALGVFSKRNRVNHVARLPGVQDHGDAFGENARHGAKNTRRGAKPGSLRLELGGTLFFHTTAGQVGYSTLLHVRLIGDRR